MFYVVVRLNMFPSAAVRHTVTGRIPVFVTTMSVSARQDLAFRLLPICTDEYNKNTFHEVFDACGMCCG